MLTYLTKFNNLPKEIKDRLADPIIKAAVLNLEKNYKLSLASTIMKLIVGEINQENLANYLKQEFNLKEVDNLVIELKAKILEPILSIKSVVNQPIDFGQQVEAKIANLIKQINVSFSSEILLDRFKQILRTYLRGVRDKINTKESLMKTFEAGGLNFDQASAENILYLASNEVADLSKYKIVPPPKINLSADRQTIRDVEYNLEAALKARFVDKTNELPKQIITSEKIVDKTILNKIESDLALPQLDLNHELAPLTPSLSVKLKEQVIQPIIESPKENLIDQVTESTSEPRTEKIEAKTAEIKTEPIIADQTIKPISLFYKTESGKIKMDDIQYRPRIFGPIEELKFMNLKTWRRISLDPEAVKEKIKLKISGLEKESYSKKVEAINAWKISPINQLYVNICRLSLTSGKSAKAVLADKRQAEPDYLTDAEFDMIIKLNQELKF